MQGHDISKAFASKGDLTEKTIGFTEIGEGLCAFTAEGDPNSGVIIGDDSVMVVAAQATPRLAQKVIDCIRSVTDKPISHVVLNHCHAVRALGASAFNTPQVIIYEAARNMVAERGQEDRDSAFQRVPRLFQRHEAIPGLPWPTTTFNGRRTVRLGRRRVDLLRLDRAHTAGGAVNRALDRTKDFVESTYRPVARVAARNGSRKEACGAARAECDPKLKDCATDESCLPFNVADACDAARGISHPRIWTAERDLQMWAALQG